MAKIKGKKLEKKSPPSLNNETSFSKCMRSFKLGTFTEFFVNSCMMHIDLKVRTFPSTSLLLSTEGHRAANTD